MAEEVLKLETLSKDEVPRELRWETYFDFAAHPFWHEALFRGEKINSVYAVIRAIGDYAKAWLSDKVAEAKNSGAKVSTTAPRGAMTSGKFEIITEKGATFKPGKIVGSTKPDKGPFTIIVAKGASVFGSDIYLDSGSIYVGEGTTIEPGVGVKGATIIGKDTEIRQGSYLRGDVITGDGCTLRGELKNVVMMNKANFPHPSYVGDSLCGYMSHFGNQATAANLGIFEGMVPNEKRKNIIVRLNGKGYDLGKPKMGVCLGDFSQVGCNSVADPGTFLAPQTIVYALTRITKGFYGPNEILKNKPMEKGVIERSQFNPR